MDTVSFWHDILFIHDLLNCGAVHENALGKAEVIGPERTITDVVPQRAEEIVVESGKVSQ
jgi:hypothetical protein